MRTILEVLKHHTLYAKMSKRKFGVQADPSKIATMVEWHVPRTLISLRGFLGLIGYYRKFIKGYGFIVAPLTLLLKGNSLHWSEEAATIFELLKKAVSYPPVLRLPYFT